MSFCAMLNCNNYTKKAKKSEGISYFHFPRDPVRCDKWRKVVSESRQEPLFKAKIFHTVCSDHFRESDMYVTQKGLRRLKNTAVPVLKFDVEEKILEITLDENASNSNMSNMPTTADKSENDTENCEDVSDVESVYDSPKEAKLRKELRRKINLQKRHYTKMDSVRRQNDRLRKKILCYKELVENLKKERDYWKSKCSKLQ